MTNLSCIPKFVKKEIIDLWVSETWRLMLLNDTHVPNVGVQQFISDVIDKQITATGGIYLTGGMLVNNKISVADPLSLNNYFIDADDIVIGPNSGLNYRFGVAYKVVDINNHAVNPIRAHIDFITPQIVVNGTSKIKWNTLGIIYIS